MAQPPYKVDQVQIEPGAAGTRLIDRDSSDDSLRFSDPYVTAVLSALLGVRNISGLFIVGQGGDGSPYTSVQDALDAAPDTSSPSAPSIVLLMGGEYSENLVVQKDGIRIVGLGKPKITNANPDATIWINDAAPLTTPESFVIEGVVVENTDPGEECILIEGAGTFATGSVTVNTAPLTAGDTLTIGGIALTGVAGARTPGNDDFSVDGVTTAAIAAEIVAAINDAANSFTALVAAELNGSAVDLTATTPGVGGNAITLLSSTADMTVSGPTLTGGSAAGSPVGIVGIDVLGCDLVASGAGGYQIRADTMNHIRVQGGTWRGSSSSSSCLISQCASFRVSDVEWVNHLELDYDSGSDQPLDPTSAYEVTHCGRVGDVLSNEIGVGSLLLADVPTVGDVTQGGDRTLDVTHCRIGDLAVSDTVAVSLVDSPRGALSVPIGTPTVAESVLTESAALVGAATLPVVFDAPQPDSDYAVYVDVPNSGIWANVTAKAAAGFTITFSAPVTGTVFYTVTRQM